MRQKFTVFSLLLISFILFVASSNNPPNAKTGAPGENLCTQCHTPSNPPQNGNVAIDGLPETVVANMTYNITVTANVTTGSANRAGFQLVALDELNTNAGSMSSDSNNPTITMFEGRTYAEHNPALFFNGNTAVSWSFDWTAPAGPDGEEIKMYAASVLANGANGNSNDRVVTNIVSTTLDAPILPLTLDIVSQADVNCNGGSDGQAEVIATGGLAPLTYSWSNGSTGAIVSNLTAETHTVTVTDAENSTLSIDVTIEEPDELVGEIEIENLISCFGFNDGTATINVTGGVEPYSYQWSNGGTNNQESQLEAGLYIITTTDANDCEHITEFFLDEPSALSISILDIFDADCNGEASGSISLDFSGGVGGYSAIWSNGQSGPQIDNLLADDYIVTLTDANNCELSEIYTINEPEILSVDLSITQMSSAGANDGAITAFVTGGTETYEYNWSNGESGMEIEDLSPGVYSLTITDANDCSTETSATILSIDCDLLVELTVVDPTCNGGNDGSISTAVTGGVGTITYMWSTGDTSPDLSNLEAGDYGLTVTDEDGCVVNTSASLSNPIPILASVTGVMNVECVDDENGAATISPVGGLPPYTYLWEDGSTDSINQNLVLGINTVTITDANNCSIVKSVEISAFDPIAPEIQTRDTTIYVDENGFAQLTLDAVILQSSDNCGIDTSFLSQYSFSCAELGINQVQVTVIDINGLSSMATALVTVMDSIPPTMTCSPDISINSCNAVSYDSPIAMDNCGIDTLILIQGLPSGSMFPVGVTQVIWESIDIFGNTAQCAFNVTVSSDLSVSEEIIPPSCFGVNDGSISIDISGGSAPYTIMWSTGESSNSLVELFSGEYEVVIIDDLGCVLTTTYFLPDPEPIIITIDSIYHDVNESGVGAIDISISGGAAPYEISWFNNGNLISNEEDPDSLQMGIYQLLVADTLGCSVISEVEVSNVSNTIAENDQVHITIHPNPSADYIWIDANKELSGSLTMYSQNGKRIKSIDIVQRNTQIGLNDIDSGIYFIVYAGPNYYKSFKFIKQ